MAQYLNAVYKRSENVTVTQRVDMKYYNDGASFDEHDDSRMSRWFIRINVKADTPEAFTLSLRIPSWVVGTPDISVNDEAVKNISSHDGCFDIERTWKDDTITIYFETALTTASLPDAPELMAFLEGPIVLAGLCDKDCGIYVADDNPESALVSTTEHTYETFPWKQSTYRTINQPENFEFVPLYDITDEPYTIYFSKKSLS